MEDQAIRFRNAIDLNGVLLLALLAYVPNRLHDGLTPLSRMEDEGGAALVTRGNKAAAELGLADRPYS